MNAKKMPKLFFILLCVFSLSTGFIAPLQAASPAVSEVELEKPQRINRYFPDKVLAVYVARQLSKSMYDLTTLEELSRITRLELGGLGIKNLTGLELLTNLTYLDLDKNVRIVDISPLRNLTQLTHLYLSHNRISDITPLANLTSLEELYMANNKIDDISALAQLSNLVRVVLPYNHVSDLTPLLGLENLYAVDASWQTLEGPHAYYERFKPVVLHVAEYLHLDKLLDEAYAYNQQVDVVRSRGARVHPYDAENGTLTVEYFGAKVSYVYNVEFRIGNTAFVYSGEVTQRAVRI